jgi:CO/xanthine dehydrogenase FAD-binding subunit
MGLYLRPTDLDDALTALAGRSLTVLAGGTDFYPARVGRALTDDIMDISGLACLRGITDADEQFRLGALTTWNDLLDAPLPSWFDCLKLAAREVGGVQIQNAGTIAGNLCNASPAADGIPALLALDASVELATRDGRRVLPVTDFVLGNRRTARRPEEMVTSLIVPKPRFAARATFTKLGARKYLVISIVMVAAVIEVDAGRVAAARIAVGACSPVATRLPTLEKRLLGCRIGSGIGRAVVPEDLLPLAPIDDVRGAATYRRDAAQILVARALDDLAARKDP